jgi:hypothetical protein
VSIRERPAEAEDRAIPGHWEGDLLLGRHWTQVATVVERSTRFTVLVALEGRDMTTVTAGLSRQMTRLPEQLRKSLTWDRGMELADHKTVTVTTGLDVYFADPRSPWQRGTNENTNDGLNLSVQHLKIIAEVGPWPSWGGRGCRISFGRSCGRCGGRASPSARSPGRLVIRRARSSQ